MKKIKVAHLTSAHKDNDIRIFHKECSSLADAGFDITEIALNGKTRTENGVKIEGVPLILKSRLDRMRKAPKEIYMKALEINADIYHIHDPELLRIGLKLLKKGKIVIYDAHEDTPRQILSKPYLNPFLRKIVSFFYERFENYAAQRMSAIVTVTPRIKNRYDKLNKRVVEVANFPLSNEIESGANDKNISPASQNVIYIGGISYQRGIKEMIIAAGLSDVNLHIAGDWPAGLEKEVSQIAGWDKVVSHGFCSREKLTELKRNNIAGLVTLLPEPNHIDSYPIKMFEYMAAGLPVIASNFPLWKSIIEKNKCGICVDPSNPTEIASAIQFLSENPTKVKEMGENGLKAVHEQYNWDIEKKKLIALYNELSA